MIEYIKGSVASLSPTAVVVENGSGIGFRLNITLPTFSALEGSNEAMLYVHEAIRDDAWTLYGFATELEREHFRSLIGVSGVGASTAVIILSSLRGDELAAVIATGDVKRLKSIKGIGAKTAERIIVDLRDKIKGVSDTLFTRSLPDRKLTTKPSEPCRCSASIESRARRCSRRYSTKNPARRSKPLSSVLCR